MMQKKRDKAEVVVRWHVLSWLLSFENCNAVASGKGREGGGAFFFTPVPLRSF